MKLLINNRRTLIIFVLLSFFIISYITTPNFYSGFNLLTIIRVASITGIVAIGMTFVTLSGNFVSLSAQQTGVLVSIVFMLMLKSNYSLGLALFVSLVIAVFTGFIQGIFVNLGLNPIITTLTAGIIFFGIASLLTGSRTITIGISPADVIGRGSIFGIPNHTVALLLLLGLSIFILNRTKFGREMFLVGDNPFAAKSSGINIRFITLMSFIISAITAFIAGIFYASQFGQANLNQFANLNLDAISAIVVGGTSLQGGEGSTIRSAIGALFISMIQNLMLLNGFRFGYRILVSGIIISVAVLIYQLSKDLRR